MLFAIRRTKVRRDLDGKGTKAVFCERNRRPKEPFDVEPRISAALQDTENRQDLERFDHNDRDEFDKSRVHRCHIVHTASGTDHAFCPRNFASALNFLAECRNKKNVVRARLNILLTSNRKIDYFLRNSSERRVFTTSDHH